MAEICVQETMTQQQRAVAVAKDVIKRLKYIKLAEGVYVKGTLPLSVNFSGDLKSHVSIIQKNCRVCLKGALLLSKARLFDAVPMSLLNEGLYTNIICVFGDKINVDSNNTTRSLLDTFDRKTIDMAECAFERTYMNYGTLTQNEMRNSIMFSFKFKTKKQVVEGVMKNIVKNKGKFIPPNVEWDQKCFEMKYLR